MPLNKETNQNVQTIRWSHYLYRENYENLVSGIDSRTEKLNWNKDPKSYIPKRCAITITIYNCDDALNHILRKCIAGYKLTKSLEKINHLMYIDDTKLFAKMKKNWKL